MRKKILNTPAYQFALLGMAPDSADAAVAAAAAARASSSADAWGRPKLLHLLLVLHLPGQARFLVRVWGCEHG